MLNLRTFTIKRLAATEGGSKKRTYGSVPGTITGFRETASPEFTAIVDGEFGKTFALFTDDFDADIRIGDRLVDSDDAQEYDVKGVVRNEDGPGRKMQITMTLPIDQ